MSVCRTKCDTRFRWVQCQLDEIAKLKTMRDIREALDHLPAGLQETYENILHNVPAGCVKIVRQVLHWLVCDVWPLALAELHECLAIEPDMDHIDEESQLSSPMDIYDLCGSLIALTAEGEVILAHLSVKDYLLSDAIKQGKASKFSISELEANAENTLKCLKYLSFAEFRNGPSRNADEFEARLDNNRFLNHASRWWATYAENAGSSSKEMQDCIIQFFTPSCRPQFMSWLQVLCSDVMLGRRPRNGPGIKRQKRQKFGYNEYPKNATSLYYAASFGIGHVVLALLEQGAEVDADGGRLGATAFHAAALRGHVKIMEILLKHGADPNKMDIIKKTPLHSAALTGNMEVIKYLLDIGADPDARDVQNKSAYDQAIISGHTAAAKLLAENMPNLVAGTNLGWSKNR
jgi:hypothetical protein